jgi:hypothetical protein
MSENLSKNDCFDAAADFLGQDWLDTQVEKFRKSDSHKTAPRPVKNYRRARKELGHIEDEFASHFPETSMPTLEFINLGRYVLFLRESGAGVVHPESFEVLDTSLAECFATDLRNPRHYERTLYELQTGYFYSRRGHTVQFLAEEKSDAKTPDILLQKPSKIFIECKRVDAVSNDVQKAKSIAGELNERAVGHLEPGHAAVFEYSSYPEMRDLEGVTDEIPPSTCDGPTSVELPFGTVTVYNLKKVFGEKGVWIADSGKSAASEHEEMYETYLQPLVKKVVGEELSLSEIEYETKTERLEWSTRIEYEDLRFSCVPSRYDRNRVARVAGQVDKARRKFGKEYPNILHIDTPFKPAIAEEIIDDIRDAIGKRLASTRRVTAVTVSLPIKERGDAGAEAIRHQAVSIRHTNPYADLPSKFEVLGTDIT